MARYETRRSLSTSEEVGMVLPNMSRPAAVERAAEVSSELFNLANIVVDGRLSVITTLEFLQHDFL